MKEANQSLCISCPFRFLRLLPFLFSVLAVFGPAVSGAESDSDPIAALMITGGGWHDYDNQQHILSEGIGERTRIEWTIDHEGGDDSAVRISRHENTDWADDFDVVVYNMCFSNVEDAEWVERIAAAHHETGLPAVFVHCAIHSYRRATDEWHAFGGVVSVRHESHRPFTVENLAPGHPIMKPFPESWRTPAGELYEIVEVLPNATPLARAYGEDTDRHHVTVWTNQYGEARVFGTTIGHHNETMATGEYLDLVTRGLLWTVGKLEDDGSPAPGYGPDGGTARRLVLVAGTPSHGRGTHEHNAGVRLFKDCLEGFPGLEVTAHYNGWPEDPDAFEGADGILLYMDGGGGHPVIQGDRLSKMAALMEQGVGLAAFHYAVEVPADRGGPEFLEWIGGHYETQYSVNPIWTAEYTEIPGHPITRGVEPFSVRDEWYFNIRFRPDMENIEPILKAKPSDGTRDGPYVHPQGPYPHIVEAKGDTEIMAWAVERADGGRGFGFTGGHFHENWGDDNFRKVALNALVWITGAEVPDGGVESSVTEEYLEEHLD